MRAVTPRWKPVCKKTVRSKIIKKGKPFEFNYQTYKCRYGKPSATLDLWTSRARLGFLAVSLHLQTKNHVETKVLDVAYIPTPHTAENVKKKNGQVLQQYELNEEDVFKAVTDNASNMKKAFRVNLWDDEDDEEEYCRDENKEIANDEENQDMEVEMGKF